PSVSGTPVCAGSNVNISFIVTNGWFDYFTTSTTYNVYLENEVEGANSRTHLKSFQSSSAPSFLWPYATVTEVVFIPGNVVGRTDYRIFISSTSPTVRSGNSSRFSI